VCFLFVSLIYYITPPRKNKKYSPKQELMTDFQMLGHNVGTGQERQPKWGHLKDLHAALKLCEPALAAVDDVPPSLRLGPNQEVPLSKSHDFFFVRTPSRKATWQHKWTSQGRHLIHESFTWMLFSSGFQI
jgi:hypothetical protein